MGSHTGTHIDAPLHFVDGGKTTIEIPLEKLIGPCQVVDFQGKTSITAADLAALHLPQGTQKLLFKTDNSRLWADPTHPFFEDFCALTADAAQWVVDNGIHLVGGGGLLRGLDQRLSQVTGVPVHTVAAPLECVVLGAGRCVENYESLRFVLMDHRR